MSGAVPEGIPSGSFEGHTFGSYRILRAIAAGGMATVYLARKVGPRGFAQNAAIKVVHPHLALQPEFVEMFLDEARIISLINHPNVCRVFDFGACDGTYYLAMEYVRGETLADVLAALRAHPRGEEAIFAVTAWVLSQTCEGLHAAHEAHDEAGLPLQIVHRDVSPQNLLVGYDGSLRIVDFGVAYAAERSHATRDGAVKGRYQYMAPEQMRGHAVDRRADIWSVGVILREALTGVRLFARDNDAATIFAVTEQPLPPWPDHVPMALRRVADRALSREVEGRFSTAREMGRELTRARDSATSAGVDLSEWMGELFAENIERKNALIRELAQLTGTSASSGEDVRSPLRVAPSPTFAAVTPPRNTPAGARTPPRNSSPMVAPTTSAVRELGKGRVVEPAQAAPHPAVPLPRSTWMWPAFGAAGVGVMVLLYLLLSSSPPGRPPDAVTVVQGAAPIVPPVVVQAMVPSVLAASGPAGATVQEVAPSATSNPVGATVQELAPAPLVTTSQPPEESAPKAQVASSSERTKSRPRRGADAAPSRKQAEHGTVAIGASGGWADVFLGTRRLGTTPVVATLPTGSHTLTVYPFGKGPAQRSRVEVKAGEQTKHKLDLAR